MNVVYHMGKDILLINYLTPEGEPPIQATSQRDPPGLVIYATEASHASQQMTGSFLQLRAGVRSA